MSIGFLDDEPLKITSSIDAPRKCFADDSPITQRTASMVLDFPQPFGPTIPVKLLGKLMVVASTKDLKPASLILLKRILLLVWVGDYQGHLKVVVYMTGQPF